MSYEHSLSGCKFCVEGTLGKFICVAKSVLTPVSRTFSFNFLLLERKASVRLSDAAGTSDEAAVESWGTGLFVGSAGAAIDFEISLGELDAFEDEFLRPCL